MNMKTVGLHSFGVGIATLDANNDIIEVYYPSPMLSPEPTLVQALSHVCGYSGGNKGLIAEQRMLPGLAKAANESDNSELAALFETLAGSQQAIVLTFLADDLAPTSVAEVYLKLHLLSHRLCQPHTVNLQGAFGILQNLAWTNAGAITLKDLPSRQLEARKKGELLTVLSVDKFPRMSDYVVPSGVRIADTARVRLGAHIGEGTTIMHEGFVNFNAGTLGTAMIEGRISAGVIVGNGSDLGGGCSTMGTLSGGGTAIISVGQDCLIGANAGIGIALGDRCIVEAGLYVTAGTKVQLLDKDNQPVKLIKARELTGKSDLLFRRNSQTGAVECKTNSTSIALNDELHSNN